jgi:hypothetical protein
MYDADENGNCSNVPGKKPGHYTYKTRTIPLNRAMLASINGVIEDGLVADHIDNNKDNYNLNNLQAITQEENANKDKSNWHITEKKCNMRKPKSFYEEKLENFLQQYEAAKVEGNAEKVHSLRSNVSQTRARLRYWESHKEEYEKYLASRKAKINRKQNIKEKKILEEYKKIFKENGNKAMWHQMCKVIKSWDQFESIQKEHVFEVLNNMFSKRSRLD